jgi:hypothetical protein
MEKGVVRDGVILEVMCDRLTVMAICEMLWGMRWINERDYHDQSGERQ